MTHTRLTIFLAGLVLTVVGVSAAPAYAAMVTPAADQPPVFTSANQTSAVVGSTLDFSVTTTAGSPSATTITESGSLPTGITFTDNGNGTASLAGTPATGTGKRYPITLSAAAVGGTVSPATQSFTLDVDEAPRITSDDHLTINTGILTRFTVTTIGGYPRPPAITLAGSLPSGIDFADNGEGTALLSGTASELGIFPLTLNASNGLGQQTSQAFTLTVRGAPRITSAPSTTFTAGVSATFTITTRAGLPAGTTFAVQGSLPPGITFTDNGNGTAELAGRTTQTGRSEFLITAENGIAPGDLQRFTLTVLTPPSAPPVTPSSPAPSSSAEPNPVPSSPAPTNSASTQRKAIIQGGPQLAGTGPRFDPGRVLGIGALLVLVGAAAVFSARRRRPSPSYQR